MRRLLRQHDLTRDDVEGTGYRGRITRNDVLAAVAARRAAPPVSAPAAAAEAPAPAAAPPDPDVPPVAVPPAPAPDAGGGVQWTAPGAADAPIARPIESPPDGATETPVEREAVEPVAAPEEPVAQTAVAPAPEPAADDDLTVISWTPLRRHAAEEAVASLQETAHAFCAVEVDFHRVERVRRAQLELDGDDLGYLPFVARAVVEALVSFPQLNAAVDDSALVVRRSVHLGVAVDLDDYRGRIVPVVRDADDRLLRGIAREIAALEARAQVGELDPASCDGGTFTITRPGVGDTLVAVPIIQRPQVAVLATDGARRRPVLVRTPDGSEGITVHAVGTLGLSFDQRAIDASYASAFMDGVRTLLESRDWSTEL